MTRGYTCWHDVSVSPQHPAAISGVAQLSPILATTAKTWHLRCPRRRLLRRQWRAPPLWLFRLKVWMSSLPDLMVPLSTIICPPVFVQKWRIFELSAYIRRSLDVVEVAIALIGAVLIWILPTLARKDAKGGCNTWELRISDLIEDLKSFDRMLKKTLMRPMECPEIPLMWDHVLGWLLSPDSGRDSFGNSVVYRKSPVSCNWHDRCHSHRTSQLRPKFRLPAWCPRFQRFRPGQRSHHRRAGRHCGGCGSAEKEGQPGGQGYRAAGLRKRAGCRGRTMLHQIALLDLIGGYL